MTEQRHPIKATARQRSRPFAHTIEIRGHELTVDEPREDGGEDAGPTPQELLAASLASCTAITMEMYARRKGWNLADMEVECEYTPVERGWPTQFNLVLRIPSSCTQEELDKLRVIAAKCPIHRMLDGEVTFEERLERAERASAEA